MNNIDMSGTTNPTITVGDIIVNPTSISIDDHSINYDYSTHTHTHNIHTHNHHAQNHQIVHVHNHYHHHSKKRKRDQFDSNDNNLSEHPNKKYKVNRRHISMNDGYRYNNNCNDIDTDIDMTRINKSNISSFDMLNLKGNINIKKEQKQKISNECNNNKILKNPQTETMQNQLPPLETFSAINNLNYGKHKIDMNTNGKSVSNANYDTESHYDTNYDSDLNIESETKKQIRKHNKVMRKLLRKEQIDKIDNGIEKYLIKIKKPRKVTDKHLILDNLVKDKTCLVTGEKEDQMSQTMQQHVKRLAYNFAGKTRDGKLFKTNAYKTIIKRNGTRGIKCVKNKNCKYKKWLTKDKTETQLLHNWKTHNSTVHKIA